MSILGIDIGGTKTIVALADSNGNIIHRRRFNTPGKSGPQIVLGQIIVAGRELLNESGASESDIEGIGIACGGPLDPREGRLIFVPNIPGWENLPVAHIFSEEFKAPAWLENDATAAGFAEAVFGAGKGVKYLAYFTISTGIGGAIIIDGKPYRGRGNAAEFGHQKILPNGPLCTCGDHGCLEALASGTSISGNAAEGLKDNPNSLLFQWTQGDRTQITAEMVNRAAVEGDSYASGIWDTAMGYLGIGVANVVNILNPEMVVLGGGVTCAGDRLLNPVRRTVAERAMSQLAQDASVVLAGLGEDSAIYGAITVALEKLGKLCSVIQ